MQGRETRTQKFSKEKKVQDEVQKKEEKEESKQQGSLTAPLAPLTQLSTVLRHHQSRLSPQQVRAPLFIQPPSLSLSLASFRLFLSPQSELPARLLCVSVLFLSRHPACPIATRRTMTTVTQTLIRCVTSSATRQNCIGLAPLFFCYAWHQPFMKHD
jgi:hypothetical protein